MSWCRFSLYLLRWAGDHHALWGLTDQPAEFFFHGVFKKFFVQLNKLTSDEIKESYGKMSRVNLYLREEQVRALQLVRTVGMPTAYALVAALQQHN